MSLLILWTIFVAAGVLHCRYIQLNDVCISYLSKDYRIALGLGALHVISDFCFC